MRRHRWKLWERLVAVVVIWGSATGAGFLTYGIYRGICLILS